MRYELYEERHPDKRPSSSQLHYNSELMRDLVCVLEIKDEEGRQLGALVMRSAGDRATGARNPVGVAIFTREEILFE